MITDTHIYVCLQPSDAQLSHPVRDMDKKEFAEYVRFRCLKAGMNIHAPIAVAPRLGYVVLSQRRPDGEAFRVAFTEDQGD